MTVPQLPGKTVPVRRKSHWFEKIMAAIALANLGFVVFDLSYISLRDLYLRLGHLVEAEAKSTQVFAAIQWYGEQFKGIEPHRATEAYLQTVTELENEIVATGISSETTGTMLVELRDRSANMVDEDPFQVAGKSGTLERIKQRMRDRIVDTTGQEASSSKDAFATFWSVPYLTRYGVRQELEFFDTRIQPLIATNYYRSIGFDGRPINDFWKIDRWFIALFAIEFLARTWYISRRYKGMSWFDAMLWRWYDTLFLIPFSLLLPSLALLRIIPLIIRINHSHLINLEPMRNRITRGIIANIAVELTEIVVIRIIDQVQTLIRQGDIARSLLKPGAGPRYIDLNNVDELSVISQRLSNTVLNQVLPKVRPDIEALMSHSVNRALTGVPGYHNLQQLPGVEDLSHQLTQRVVNEVYNALYGAITSTMTDQVGAELTKRLLDHVGDAFRDAIQKGQSLEELESLVTVWLDEVKINYVQRIAQEDIDQLREKTQRLYEITQSGNR